MTIDEAVPALDALVAERVMYDHRFEKEVRIGDRSFKWKHRGELFEAPPPYSIDIRYAMKVVHELATRTSPWHLMLRNWPSDIHPGWSARFSSGSRDEHSSTKRHVEADAETAELAICIAALLVDREISV